MNYLLLLLFVFPMTLISQNFTDLQWKNRIILIEANSLNNQDLKEQIRLLGKVRDKWSDYKLAIIERTNNHERRDLEQIERRQRKENYVGFKVYLIGLDGTIKFESDETQDAQIFFDLISSMPMYKSKNRKK